MYSRKVEDQLLTFGVSGKLIMNTLVMYDHQTRTLWAQSLYKGVEGPMAGAELTLVPATQTRWGLWRDLHPDTLVLDKGGAYRYDSYDGYYRNGSAGIFGETRRDSRLDAKDLVVGVRAGGKFKAYSLLALRETPVVNDSLGGIGLLVFFDRETETALVFSSEVDGLDLTFRMLPGGSGATSRLVDDQTGSTWSPVTGSAVDGELAGKALERALSHLSFWFAWKDWNPDTELYGG